jgi:hypothetical protein
MPRCVVDIHIVSRNLKLTRQDTGSLFLQRLSAISKYCPETALPYFAAGFPDDFQRVAGNLPAVTS